MFQSPLLPTLPMKIASKSFSEYFETSDDDRLFVSSDSNRNGMPTTRTRTWSSGSMMITRLVDSESPIPHLKEMSHSVPNTPVGRSPPMHEWGVMTVNKKSEEKVDDSSDHDKLLSFVSADADNYGDNYWAPSPTKSPIVLSESKKKSGEKVSSPIITGLSKFANFVLTPLKKSKKNKKKDEEVFLSEISIDASNDTTNFQDVSTMTIKMAGVLSPVKRVSPEDTTEVKGLCQYLEGASLKDTDFGVVTKNIHLSKIGSRPTASSSSVGLKKNPAIARILNTTSSSDSIGPTEPTQKCRQEGLVACREKNIALSRMLSDNRCDKTEKEESCELVSDYSEKLPNALEEENNVHGEVCYIGFKKPMQVFVDAQQHYLDEAFRLNYTTSPVTDSPLSNAPDKSTVKDTYESLTTSSSLATVSPAVPSFNWPDDEFGLIKLSLPKSVPMNHFSSSGIREVDQCTPDKKQTFEEVYFPPLKYPFSRDSTPYRTHMAEVKKKELSKCRLSKRVRCSTNMILSGGKKIPSAVDFSSDPNGSAHNVDAKQCSSGHSMVSSDMDAGLSSKYKYMPY